MRNKLDAARAAGLISQSSPEADRELEGLVKDPAAGSILGELLTWPDGEVPFWALGPAEKVLSSHEYNKALRKAARDSYAAVSLRQSGG